MALLASHAARAHLSFNVAKQTHDVSLFISHPFLMKEQDNSQTKSPVILTIGVKRYVVSEEEARRILSDPDEIAELRE